MKLHFAEPPAGPGRIDATVAIEVADAALRERLAKAIGGLALPRAPRYPTVVVRTGDEDVAGKIAVLPVRTARTLADRVERVRAAGPLGIQLVFDDSGLDIARATRLRTAIFAVLESARGGRGCPLFLARTRRPCLALRLAISQKGAQP